MFRRIFGPSHEEAADTTERALERAADGETATVRRIVARLEELPPEKARLAASSAYICSRVSRLPGSSSIVAIGSPRSASRCGTVWRLSVFGSRPSSSSHSTGRPKR